MIQEFNTHQFPNGGWAFRQPQTGWSNPMAMVGFDASVQAIVNHRLANKAITAKHGLATDPYAVKQELIRYTKKRLGIADPPPSFFRLSHSQSAEGVAVAGAKWLAQTVRRTATGIATIGDLKRSGREPVLPEIAERRAKVCAGEAGKPETKCPKNLPGDLLSIFTKPIAGLIRSQIEEKTRLKLRTSRDADLGVCDACSCPMELKVHFPLDIIKAHIKQPELEQLDHRCWILHEQ